MENKKYMESISGRENEKYMESIPANENELENQAPPQEESSRSGKLFFLVFGLILAGSVFTTYYRMLIQKDYVIESQVDCDPMEKACFIWECDPASNVEGEACTGDPETDIGYYNLAKRNASRIPLCDPKTDESCLPMLCEPGEEDCEEIFCNAENKLEQEAECNDPVAYALENPPEEEGEEELTEELECEAGDTECLSASEEESESDEEASSAETELPTDEASDSSKEPVPAISEPSQPAKEAIAPAEKAL